MGVSGRLLLTCPDQRGLVARVADFVWKLGGNIVDADQHTDDQEGIFFQRIEFLLDGVAATRAEMAEQFAGLAAECGMRWSLTFSDQRQRVAVLVSKQAHCLYDLLARWRSGELLCDVVAVISNWPDHAEAARHFGVAYHEIPVAPDSREAQEAALLQLIDSYRVDLVVLARYMQILGPLVVEPYRNRIVNIHHSFLPAFSGGRPYAQAHARGVKLIGATAHYATEELDEGPIIAQGVVSVTHRDSVAEMARKGRDLETSVLARAVAAHVGDRILAYGRKTVVFE